MLVIVAVVLFKLLADSLLVRALDRRDGAREAIYRAALYVFASEGVVPEPFDGAELHAIWHVTPADPPAPEPKV